MVTISDLNEASILWNLRIRYDNQNIYTYIGKRIHVLSFDISVKFNTLNFYYFSTTIVIY